MRVALTFLIASLFLLSCQDRDKKGQLLDTPTSGTLKIVADESLRPLIETEIATFNGIYTKANIQAEYLSESDAMDALLNDSVRLAVVTRRLTPEEKKFFKDNQMSVAQVDVAESGIAIIVHKENRDTLINMSQLAGLLQGKINNWQQLGSRKNAGIEIVFDSPKSGLIRHLKDSVAKVQTLPAYCFAVKNNEAVVDHVSKNVNAMGLIGLEWISDRDDSTSNSFLNRVKVMAVAGDSTHFQPFQAYIALKYYPLRRTITLINREARSGLNAGFIAFFASERGQRIVLKMGLVPKTMPLRIVQVNPKPFKIEK